MSELRQVDVKELRALEDERDALAAKLQGPDGFATWKDAAVDERVRRVSAEKREKALAAHVGRLREAVEFCNEHHHFGCWTDLLDETPATSLARLKAQWQAEALEDALGLNDQCVERKMLELQRQAEEVPK